MIYKYSIIIPVYNAESTLRRCVDSILAQTVTDFELILVNDGSKDLSAEIIDKYAAKDSHVVAVHKPNGGVSSARNAGLEKARGKYILFADADDEMKPCWIECFKTINNNYDICVQGIEFVGNTTEKRSIGKLCGDDCRSLTERLMLHGSLGYTFGKMFQRDIIERHHLRFDETIHFREDDVFVLQYLEHAKTWASSDEANYIYYLPNADKKYKSSATECTELVLRSLNNIYGGNIPEEIYQNQAWSIKGEVVQKILEGQPLSALLTEAYKRAFCKSKGLRNRFLNFLILHNRSLGKIPSIILKITNRK